MVAIAAMMPRFLQEFPGVCRDRFGAMIRAFYAFNDMNQRRFEIFQFDLDL